MHKTSKRQQHSLIFCHACGALLDPPAGIDQTVICHCCATTVDAKVFESTEVISRSKPASFPERPPKIVTLDSRDDHSLDSNGEDRTNAHLRDGATIKEKCPKCDAPEMVFHTAQLRSADEGQTIFYSCIKCGHKFSMNS